MKLSKKDISEYKALYKDSFGDELDNSQAHQSAIALLTLVKSVYKPINKNKLQKMLVQYEK